MSVVLLVRIAILALALGACVMSFVAVRARSPRFWWDYLPCVLGLGVVAWAVYALMEREL